MTNSVRKALGPLATAGLIASLAATMAVGAVSATTPVVGSPITIGTINNTVDGTAQAIPSVIIGANDQATGTVVLREAQPGMFSAAVNQNILRVCYQSTTGQKAEVFTRAPWLVVTAGNLSIRAISDPTIPSGGVAAGTGVRGYLGSYTLPQSYNGPYCAQWIVFTPSTTASTLEIRGSAADGTMLPAGPNNGPHVNVDAQQTPGPVTLNICMVPQESYQWWTGGSCLSSSTDYRLVQNAVRVYGANVAVAAVSQPELRKGLLNQPAGNVTITETATYQLGNYWYLGYASQAIWFQIVPNNMRDVLPSVYFNTDRVTPVVATNSAESGLIATFGRWVNNTTFTAVVNQRAFVPVSGAWVPGKITVSNIQYSATNDAALGPVQLQVCSTGTMVPVYPVYADWMANTYYAVGAKVLPNNNYTTATAGFVYQAMTAGTSSPTTEPTWPTVLGATVYDNGVNWMAVASGSTTYTNSDAACPGVSASAENSANFNQTVSNAKIVGGSSMLGSIAPGVAGPGTSTWTFNTVIVKKGTYVTLRLQAVKGAVVGDRIEIWGRTSKTGAWTKYTTRLVGANGYIFYFKKVSSYQEFQALFAGSNTAASSYAVPRYYRALGH